MSFDVGTGELLTFAGLVIGAIFTYLGVKATVAGQRDTARPADWQAFTGEMKSYFQEQLESRDRAIAEARQRSAEDRQRIAELEASDEERSEYLGWVTRVVRGIEAWAAREGLTLPPPPFMSFTEWKADRPPPIRNPPT